MKRKALTLFLLVVTGLTLAQFKPAESQLLTVTGEYRVVEVDKANQRIGVALPEAKPDVRQNWVYLQANTQFVYTETRDGGWTKTEHLTYDGFFNVAAPGKMMKVHGGRRWDGGITAKNVWM